jgi:Flp pilus assembly protein TadG
VVSHKLASRQTLRPQEERGQVIVLMVLMLVVLLGFAALVVDVGYAYYAHRSLQSSADAAALAGAQELPNATQAELIARQYSSSAGNKNSKGNINGVTTTITTKCVVSLGGCAPMNAVVVLEQAPTKTFFAGLLGLPSFTIKAQATASMRGGTPKPAHVMIVLDRTGSMGTACTIGGTKLDCAKSGLKAFLGAMDPAYDQVGLVAFAPHSGTVCNQPKTTNGAPSDYDVYTNNYLFVPLSSSYKTSATSALVDTSPLVSTIDCIKAGGTTVFAAAIDKARQTLAANHDPEAQDVMIFMTDGEANYGACASPSGTGVCSNNTSSYRTNPCGQAVTSARAASDAGVWVFGIAYDTPGAGCLGWKATGTGIGGASCATKNGIQFVCPESPAITADAALRAIAYNPQDPAHPRFYSSPDPGSLTTLFKSVAAELTEGRLLDDDAT